MPPGYEIPPTTAEQFALSMLFGAIGWLAVPLSFVPLVHYRHLKPGIAYPLEFVLLLIFNTLAGLQITNSAFTMFCMNLCFPPVLLGITIWAVSLNMWLGKKGPDMKQTSNESIKPSLAGKPNPWPAVVVGVLIGACLLGSVLSMINRKLMPTPVIANGSDLANIAAAIAAILSLYGIAMTWITAAGKSGPLGYEKVRIRLVGNLILPLYLVFGLTPLIFGVVVMMLTGATEPGLYIALVSVPAILVGAWLDWRRMVNNRASTTGP